MCIILYNEKGTPYNKQHLSVAYDNNPHGFGLMWLEEDGVHTIRGLLSKKQMFDVLEEFRGIPHVVHLRWRTRGKVSKGMCHPFLVTEQEGKKVWMMHNGTFMFLKTHKEHSDTKLFAEQLRMVTDEYGADLLFDEGFVRKMEEEIESWNKLILLRDDGAVAMFNPDKWTVKDGIWYSNTYSLKPGYRAGQKVLGKKKKGWNQVLRSGQMKERKKLKSGRVLKRDVNGHIVEVRA